jgi:hypothetical protein
MLSFPNLMIVPTNEPGTGSGWERLSEALRQALPIEELDRIWAFRVVRREGQDFGTAILSRVDGVRRRIYTAGFVLTVKGKRRGQFEWFLDELGSGPLEALDELLALVPKRSDDEEPPLEVAPAAWFPPEIAAAPQ